MHWLDTNAQPWPSLWYIPLTSIKVNCPSDIKKVSTEHVFCIPANRKDMSAWKDHNFEEITLKSLQLHAFTRLDVWISVGLKTLTFQEYIICD